MQRNTTKWPQRHIWQHHDTSGHKKIAQITIEEHAMTKKYATQNGSPSLKNSLCSWLSFGSASRALGELII